MKLFKSTILAMLGLAVSLTACSDDDDYTVGAQSPGAYFSADAPSTVAIPIEGSSFEVTVYRTGLDAPASYTVVAEDPSGLFTIPATVSFSGDELTAPLTITFDPETVVTDKKYPITLSLQGGSQYGTTTYSFNAVRQSPLVTENVGTGTYIFGGFYVPGTIPGLTVDKYYMPSAPDNVTFTTYDNEGPWIDIVCPDIKDVHDGAIPVFLEPVPVANNAQYGPVYLADMYSYFLFLAEKTGDEGWLANAAEYVGASYYEPERGLFSLNVIYFVPEYGEGTSYIGEGYEYLQLDGYPDLTVSVEYKGTMILPGNDSYAANIAVTPGADVAKTLCALVPGSDENAAIQAVLDGNNTQEFKGTDPFTATFEIKEGGYYTVAAVTYDASGEPGEAAATSFEVVIGDSPYNELGTGAFVDGWILAGYNIGGKPIDVLNYAWTVPMLQSKEDPNILILNSPWTQPNCPLFANNTNTKPYRIEINATYSNFVWMLPQVSGFNETEMKSIGDAGGYLVSQNPDASAQAIYNFMLTKDLVPSTLEDGVITFVECWFSKGDDFGYSWKNPQNGYVLLPEASSAAKRRVKASTVTRPAVKGMLKATSNAVLRTDRDFRNVIDVKKMTKKHAAPVSFRKAR